MLVSLCEIKVNPGQREARDEDIQELADSISELGLLTPITVDSQYTLIAGLHRLEAVKQLGWLEIECIVRDLEGLKAELAEIDENFIRAEPSPIDYGNTRRRLLSRQPISRGLRQNDADHKIFYPRHG